MNRTQLVTPAFALVAATLVAATSIAAPATGPATAPIGLAPSAAETPAVGPIAYYIDKCARCHGDISAAYLGVNQPKHGKELETVIDDMAYGPAQSPLEPAGLKDQTDLHEAMFGKAPYVWLDPSKPDVISGEVLPGTTLSMEPAAAIKVTGHRFEAPRRKGTLVATRDGKTVRVPVGQ